MELARIAESLSSSQVVGDPAVEITDLAYDTRAVTEGALFFCVRGARFDGHELADRAIDSGAAALVVEHPVASKVPQIIVEDSRAAMADAAQTFFGHPSEELGSEQAFLLGGGAALFLAGDVLYRRTLGLGRSAWRLIAALLALATVPLGTGASAAAQLGALVAVLAAGLYLSGRSG